MRRSPKAGQGKSPVPRASKKVFSYRRRETFRRPSTFRLPSAHPQQQQLHRKVVSHQNIFFFWLECRTVFGSPFGLPLVDPNKNQEKIFFVQNDQAQYGRELFREETNYNEFEDLINVENFEQQSNEFQPEVEN